MAQSYIPTGFNMVKKKQVIQSGAWQMLNVRVKLFSQFAYYAVMARLLSKAELGIFALLNSFFKSLKKFHRNKKDYSFHI